VTYLRIMVGGAVALAASALLAGPAVATVGEECPLSGRGLPGA
jgi:hypothetical protein